MKTSRIRFYVIALTHLLTVCTGGTWLYINRTQIHKSMTLLMMLEDHQIFSTVGMYWLLPGRCAQCLLDSYSSVLQRTLRIANMTSKTSTQDFIENPSH